MKYQIREEALAWGDDYQVLDENGKLAYFVDGHGFSVFNYIAIESPDKTKLAAIEQTLLGFGREYLIKSDNVAAKVMSQRVSYGTVQFNIEVDGKNGIAAVGDFYNHDYTIQRGEKVLARVTPAEGDEAGFVVEILPPDQQVILLGCVVVIEVITRDNGQTGPMYK